MRVNIHIILHYLLLTTIRYGISYSIKFFPVRALPPGIGRSENDLLPDTPGYHQVNGNKYITPKQVVEPLLSVRLFTGLGIAGYKIIRCRLLEVFFSVFS